MQEATISSKYVDVLGSAMHYLEQGSGTPILLLHGNPTSSYVWRKIIPELARIGTCIAPDLIGMGRSEKPDLDYSFFDHNKYIEEFVTKLKLRQIILVGHDWGGALAFYYAMHHERNTRGLAFFETFPKPIEWTDLPSEMKTAFRLFRTPLVGQALIQGLNLFTKQVLPKGVVRDLDDETMLEYTSPFPDFKSRKPIWRMPNDLPISGKPADVHDAAAKWAAWLQRSDVPKLLLHASPGALMRGTLVSWCKANIRNLEAKDVGGGIHYLQEDQPAAVANSIADWIKREITHDSQGA